LLHNPFSTKNTSPGKIPYYFNKENFLLSQNKSLDFRDDFQTQNDELLQQLHQGLYHLYLKFSNFGYRSQIVGQHGTGKTTLLIPLMNFLENCHHKIIFVSLHNHEFKFPISFWEDCKKVEEGFKKEDETGYTKKPPVVVIDGYEQLSINQKAKILRLCFIRKMGILVTTHQPVWQIPILFQTKSSPKILEEIVSYLLKKTGQTLPFDQSQYSTLFEQYHGNIRDIFFSLYDLYE
jgi:DNA replication protein DnaC